MGGGEEFVVVNYYNPCQRLENDKIVRIKGIERHKIIWCADFNAHNTMWGGNHTDTNGKVIEELMEDKNLVCLNVGRGDGEEGIGEGKSRNEYQFK